MSEVSNVLLKIDGLYTSYGRIPMLMDVSLEFHDGSICCVLGANGAGKTTLIRAILGMVKADQLAKKHISLTQEDKIEVVEPEPTADSTVVTTIMSSIWQNFSGLWEYLD